MGTLSICREKLNMIIQRTLSNHIYNLSVPANK